MTDTKEIKPKPRIRVWTCTACEHEWASKSEHKPHVCPKCHKYLYIVERG